MGDLAQKGLCLLPLQQTELSIFKDRVCKDRVHTV